MLGMKKRKTTNGRISNSKKALFRLQKAMQSSLKSQNRRKKIGTKTVWTEHYVTWAKLRITTITKKTIIWILASNFQNLVSVLSTSTPLTKANKKDDDMALARVLYNYYLLCFQKNTHKIQVLLDLGSQVNAIMLAYTLKPGLWICRTNVGA